MDPDLAFGCSSRPNGRDEPLPPCARSADRAQWPSFEKSYHRTADNIESVPSNPSIHPSNSSASGSSFSHSTQSSYFAPLPLPRQIGLGSAPPRRIVDKDLPPPPPEEETGLLPLSPHLALSPGGTARAVYSPSPETPSSLGSPSLRSYLRIPVGLGHRVPASPAHANNGFQDDHGVLRLEALAHSGSKRGRNWASGTASNAASGMTASLKKLGKASTSAFRTAAHQQQQWKAERETAAAATSVDRHGRFHADAMRRGEISNHTTSIDSSDSRGRKGRQRGFRVNNLPLLSPQISPAAATTNPSSSKSRPCLYNEGLQDSWSQGNENVSLTVPPSRSMPQSASRSSRGTSRRSSFSEDANTPPQDIVDYASPPGSIMPSDPGISLPYDVQHNVHVHVGAEGYVGLPASWAEQLSSRCLEADEDDPRLDLESRMEGPYGSRRCRSRTFSFESPSRSPRLRYRRHTAHSDEIDVGRIGSLAMTDNSSSKRTVRPSTAASRTSTSYSSVLHRGWEDWADPGGRDIAVSNLTPPVPPLRVKQQTTMQTEVDKPKDAKGDKGEADWMDADMGGPKNLGLGLDLTSFNQVSTSEGGSTRKMSGRLSRKLLLPDFLSDGNKEDEDWASMLLNSIPAADDEHQVAPSLHARKSSKHQLRTKSSASSVRSKKSVTSTKRLRAPGSAHAGAERPRSPQSSLPSPSVCSHDERKLRPYDYRRPVRPSSRTFRKSTIRSTGRRRTSVAGASRPTSYRTFNSCATTYISGDEDEWSDGYAFSGAEEGEVQITTATTEKLGIASTLPKALTHIQLVSKVREYVPAVAKRDAAQASEEEKSSRREDIPQPSEPRSPISTAASTGRDPMNLSLADLAANAKKVVSPIIAASDVMSSISPKYSSIRIVSPTASSGAIGSNPTIFHPGSLVPGDQDLDNTSAMISASGAGAYADKHPIRKAAPTTEIVLGDGKATANACSVEKAVGDVNGTKMLSLRERRRMKGPARIYPPSSGQNYHKSYRARPDTILSNAADSDSGCALSTPDPSSCAPTSSVGAPDSGGRPESVSSVSGTGKGSLQAFFTRESDMGPPRGSTEKSPSLHMLSPPLVPTPVRSPSIGLGLSIINAVRKHSGSTSTDNAPRVPPKDLPALTSAGSRSSSGGRQEGQEQWSQHSKATQIGIIRPNADGFFTVSTPGRSAIIDDKSPTVRQREASQPSVIAAEPNLASPQGYAQNGGQSWSLTPHELRDDVEEDGEDEEEEEEDMGGAEHEYTAEEYLQDWIQEGAGFSLRRSPGELSTYSGRHSRAGGVQTSRKASPMLESTHKTSELSPRISGPLRSPALLSAVTNLVSGTKGSTGSPSGSSSGTMDRSLLSPSEQWSPSYSLMSGHDSPVINKVQPPVPSAEPSPSSVTHSAASVVGLAYLDSPSVSGCADSRHFEVPLYKDPDVTEVPLPQRSPSASTPKVADENDAAMSKRPQRAPSLDADVTEVHALPRPSSRVSNSSKISRRNTNKTRHRSADVRNRFPVSTHYASGFSDAFFDTSIDADTMPRQSFDLEEVLPQHLNDVPPVPPLPTANTHPVSSPPSPTKPHHFLPSIHSGAQASRLPGSTIGGPGSSGARIRSPSASRAHSRQFSTSTKKSLYGSKSRAQTSLHLDAAASLPAGDVLTSVEGPLPSTAVATLSTTSRSLSSDLPEIVRPAANFLVAADPEVIFSELTLIGSGESGDVFTALGPGKDGMQQVVAVKVVKLPAGVAEYSSSTSPATPECQTTRLSRLSKELSIWSACKHQKILALYDVFFNPCATSQYAGIWIAQELADRSLADIVSLHDDGLLISEASMAKILFDILEALQCLHSRHVIHRDVRSDNVLICPDGTAKLSDFTQAVQLENESAKRISTVGIAYWMAPELVASQPYSTQIDIWSLGATLFEMCEGQPPNVDLSPDQAVSATAKHGLPALRGTGEAVAWSQELKDFLKEASTIDPSQRATASSLLESKFVQCRAEPEQIVELLEQACDLEGDTEEEKQSEVEEGE